MKPGEFKIRVEPSDGATVKAEITIHPHGYVSDVPEAECKICGRKVKCIRVNDGMVYRLIAWVYEKPGDLIGVCGRCQVQSP